MASIVNVCERLVELGKEKHGGILSIVHRHEALATNYLMFSFSSLNDELRVICQPNLVIVHGRMLKRRGNGTPS